MTVYKKDNPEYVKQGIDSMLAQTIRTDDFVLVCDGPLTVELDELIDKYKTDNSTIFNVVRMKKNIGLGAALRHGLPLCKNRLVARMDDDDIACLDRCEKELKYYETHQEVSILGSYVIEFENDISNVIREKEVPTDMPSILAFSKRRNPFNHSTVMIDKEKILAVGNYSEMRTNQDVELWVRSLNSGLIGANLPESLVYFRFDNDTYQRRKDMKNVKLMVKVWNGFYKKGYCRFSDVLKVTIMQYGVALAPTKLIQWAYDHLR
jgi:glycosyltransferase involved in cell wall biosynthesis